MNMNSNQTDVVTELETLRRRVAELEHLEAALRQKSIEQEALLNAIPANVFFKSRDHHYLMVNETFAASFGLPVHSIVGKTDAEVHKPGIAEAYQANDEAIMTAGQASLSVEFPYKRHDGSDGWMAEHNTLVRDSDGKVIGLVGVGIDITERKQAEDVLRQREAQLQALVSQQELLIATVKELSTPVMPILDRILGMPLVGHVDTARGEQIIEAMLNAVQQHSAEFIIVDITGVPVIDTAVANHVLRGAQAVGLLGARCVLVGISPEIAQTLVQLGIDLSDLVTRSDMQAGIAYAQSHLAQTGRGRRRDLR